MRLNKKIISIVVIGVAFITIIGLSGLSYISPNSAPNRPENNTNQTGSRNASNPGESATMQKIFLQTSDNVKIAANLYTVSPSGFTGGPMGWIVFLHMRPATKESWDDLAREFQNLGYESIAIDLRGHGESDSGPSGYDNPGFDETKSILDVDVAMQYLVQKAGAVPQKISIVGASIGANLALQYLGARNDLKSAVLLSPGLDYHNVKTEEAVKNLKTGQRIFFISSRDDNRDVSQNQKLYGLVPAGVRKEIKIYDTAGHGTTMLQKESDLKQLIINFITQNG